MFIPVPLHVPPALAADNVIGSSAIQNGPAGVIVPSGTSQTTKSSVSVEGQKPPIECVTVYVPGVATAGSNVPLDALVIPVPDQAPPVSSDESCTAAMSAQ